MIQKTINGVTITMFELGALFWERGWEVKAEEGENLLEQRKFDEEGSAVRHFNALVNKYGKT